MRMLYLCLLLISMAAAQGNGNGNPATSDDVDGLLTKILGTSSNRNSQVPQQTEEGTESTPCITPDELPGNCGPISGCPSLLPLIQQLQEDKETIAFFRQSICRILPRSLHFCCPIDVPVEIPTERECGLPTGEKIINGFEVGVASWPWATSIGKPGENGGFLNICGGSLITRRHILTAAHCFVEGIPESTHVRLGEHHLTRSDDGAFPTDYRIVSHRTAGYNPITKENDIELLVLDRDVAFNDFVKPVCLPTEPSLRDGNFEGENATVIGFGSLTFTSGLPSVSSQVLMQADVPVVPLEPCSETYTTRTVSTIVNERNICAGLGTTDACSGDSGGPLNYLAPNGRYYVIGVVSHGVGCANAQFPGVYIRVGSYIDWIKNNI